MGYPPRMGYPPSQTWDGVPPRPEILRWGTPSPPPQVWTDTQTGVKTLPFLVLHTQAVINRKRVISSHILSQIFFFIFERVCGVCGGVPYPVMGGGILSSPGRGIPIQSWLGVSHPVLAGGIPCSVLARGIPRGTPHHPDLGYGSPLSRPGMGYPSVQTWDGVFQIQTWDGGPPIQTCDGVPPIQTCNGVPPHPELGCGTSSPIQTWNEVTPPLSRSVMGYPLSLC